MYHWRTLNEADKQEVRAWRERMERPFHSPHHIDRGQRRYLITAACYNHLPHSGRSVRRMNAFAEEWLAVLQAHSLRVAAWVLLPNHYHALVSTGEVLELSINWAGCTGAVLSSGMGRKRRADARSGARCARR